MRTPGWLGIVSAIACSVIAASGCRGAQPVPTLPAAPQYAPTATVKDIMQSIVDPAADAVWLSVTTVQSAQGTVDTAPKTDEDWSKVRQGAVTLTEAANLLMMPGRHVARPGEKSETPGVQLEPAEMEELIEKDRPAWQSHARALHDAGEAVLHAVDARDSQKIFELGAEIEVACESCHRQYWYPNEKIPEFPANSQ